MLRCTTCFLLGTILAYLQVPSAKGACCDVAPNDWYTCQELRSLDKCEEEWMVGYCCQSCFGCNSICLLTVHEDDFSTTLQPTTKEITCEDEPVDDLLSCAEQSALGNCDMPWLQNHCCMTCHGCSQDCTGEEEGGETTTTMMEATSTCSDISPSQYYTCEEHAFGAAGNKCGEDWMNGFCCQTCTDCSDQCLQTHVTEQPLCLNEAPDDFYTCEEQALLGNCDEDWMTGSCCHSCFDCSPSCFSGSTIPTTNYATTVLLSSIALTSSYSSSIGDVTSSIVSFVRRRNSIEIGIKRIQLLICLLIFMMICIWQYFTIT